ncbi:polysaccharide biosynthesis C-terminal domain-containing protein [Paenibacillus sp. JTLBN-2024]
MLKYAIPICLGALAISLVNLADTFTMPRLLKSGGAGEAGAMVQFGIYNRGMPVVQLVTMLATSLSVLFIPALAEAKATGDKKLIAERCRLSLRWFWLIGMAASIGIAVLAEPINIALYEDGTGTGVIRWIAFTAAGSALSIISAALLQGLGIVKAPALHLLAAAAAKALLNLLLVPQLGITGAAIASVAAHFLAAALNIALLARTAGLRIGAGRALAMPAAVLAGMALAAAPPCSPRTLCCPRSGCTPAWRPPRPALPGRGRGRRVPARRRPNPPAQRAGAAHGAQGRRSARRPAAEASAVGVTRMLRGR